MSGWAKWFWFLAIIWWLIYGAAGNTATSESIKTLDAINTFALILTVATIGCCAMSTITRDVRKDME